MRGTARTFLSAAMSLALSSLVAACAADDPTASGDAGTDASVEGEPCTEDELTYSEDVSGCDPATTDYLPRENGSADDGWEACISDDDTYHMIEESVSSIARTEAYVEIGDLLWRNADLSSQSFIAARVVYDQEEGLGSRVARRYDMHYTAPAEGSCEEAEVAAANPDYCVGPAKLLPILNAAFAAGAEGEALQENTARIQAGLQWFLYVSVVKEATTCADTPKDCDSAWAYYCGGTPRETPIGLAAEIDGFAPETHDRAHDGVLAVRCWRDLDPEVPQTNTALHAQAIDQLDVALLRGAAILTRQKVVGHVLEIERNVVGDVLALRAGGGPAVSPDSDAKKDLAPAWEARFTRDQLGLELERHLPGGVRSLWQRDKLGRPLKHEIWSGNKLLGAKSYTWEPNDRLKMIVDALHGPVRFGHDGMGNLATVVYGESKIDLRMPDAVGNLFRSNDRRDRKYGPAGQLLESLSKTGITRYAYDPEGNLALKVLPDGSQWKYEWNAAGMLAKVIRPDGQEVTFSYDALGRRVWKKYKGKTTKWIWDGNVPVHEWVELDPGTLATPAPEKVAEAEDAGLRQRAVDLAKRAAQGPPSAATEHGSADQPITWVFEPESFAPAAKLTGSQQHAIITDHLGTPTAMLDSTGQPVWSADIGIYGELRNVAGERGACPFRWPGQYEDEETGLYYNRFRYYDPDSGEYTSQDPIGIDVDRLTLYHYVQNPVQYSDVFGLYTYNTMPSIPGYQKHHIVPQQLRNHPAITSSGMNIHERSNVIYLQKQPGTHPTRSVHSGSHPKYTAAIEAELDAIHAKGSAAGWTQAQYKAEVDKVVNKNRQALRKGRAKCK